MKSKKFILPSLLVLGGIGGIIFYFIKKRQTNNQSYNQSFNQFNNQSDNQYDNQNIQMGNSGNLIINGINYAADKIKKVGYISERKDKNELVVHFAVPRPNKDYMKKNNQIMLVNMGRYNGIYNVNGTWIDANNNLGAIYLTSNKIENSNENNTEFENKGLIIKII